MAVENKVQFGLKNVHYAKWDPETSTWGTPVAIPGAVALSLEAQGDLEKFYADNLAYYVTNTNTGYSGDLEVARFPDQMLQDIWGYTLTDTGKVLVESSEVESVSFALLYQIEGDQSHQCYLMYNCTATRPNIGGNTKEDTTTPQTQTCTINAVPMTDGKVFARTTANTPADTKTNWFKSVFTE